MQFNAKRVVNPGGQASCRLNIIQRAFYPVEVLATVHGTPKQPHMPTRFNCRFQVGRDALQLQTS